MSIKTLKQQLRSDFSIYNTPTLSKKTSKALIKALRGGVKYIYYVIFIPEYKVVFWMRIVSYFRQKKAFFIIYLLAKLMHYHYYNKYGIALPIGQKIGTPVMIGHIPGIIINGNATIGNNVLIMQNVTIGSTRGKGAPRIGNNILLCAGAKIVGNVNIGDNVVVGANAVVVHDIPNNSIVAGIPAKVIGNDPERILKFYLPNYK